MFGVTDFKLDAVRLMQLASERGADYAAAKPFPHIVLDDFFPPEALDAILAEFPKPGEIKWTQFEDGTAKKLATNAAAQLKPFTSYFISQLNSSAFLVFLEALTGIDGLLPDPHLFGGGLHQIVRGGYLKVHADFNKYKRLRLERRLNLLLYLNKDWKEEYGGHIELWSRDMARCEKKALPIFNRVVIFSTLDDSYHGHPDPLACPEGWSRKSVALYYYTSGAQASPDADYHGTLFQLRPQEGEFRMEKRGCKRALKRWVPPIAFDLWHSLLGIKTSEE